MSDKPTDPEIALLIAYFVNTGPDERTGPTAAFLGLIGGKPEYEEALTLLAKRRPDPETVRLEVMTMEIMGWEAARTTAAFSAAQLQGWLKPKDDFRPFPSAEMRAAWPEWRVRDGAGRTEYVTIHPVMPTWFKTQGCVTWVLIHLHGYHEREWMPHGKTWAEVEALSKC